MSRMLEGRTAVVTGGAGGIGRATAIELAREGADVVVGDVQEESPDPDEEGTTVERIRNLGSEAVFRRTDVSNRAEATALIDAVVEKFGALDVLVNNAGILIQGGIDELSDAEWDRTLAVNLDSIYNCTKPALPHLRKSADGRVVNVASTLGLVGGTGRAAYCASKGGVVNLTRQMALEYADDGITINAVCPGIIESNMTKPRLEDQEYREYVTEVTPVPFLGRPEDVAHAVAFLVSPRSRFITGHNLVVDGGWTIK